VVFLSAKGQESEVETGLAAGAVEYILKPFAPDQLNERVKPFWQTRQVNGLNLMGSCSVENCPGEAMSAVILHNEIVHYEVLGRGRPLLFIHDWWGRGGIGLVACRHLPYPTGLMQLICGIW